MAFCQVPDHQLLSQLLVGLSFAMCTASVHVYISSTFCQFAKHFELFSRLPQRHMSSYLQSNRKFSLEILFVIVVSGPVLRVNLCGTLSEMTSMVFTSSVHAERDAAKYEVFFCRYGIPCCSSSGLLLLRLPSTFQTSGGCTGRKMYVHIIVQQRL